MNATRADVSDCKAECVADPRCRGFSVGLGLGRKGRQEGRGTACFARGCDSRLFLVQGVKATEDGEGQRIRAMGR
jgi:hypothetical protein